MSTDLHSIQISNILIHTSLLVSFKISNISSPDQTRVVLKKSIRVLAGSIRTSPTHKSESLDALLS